MSQVKHWVEEGNAPKPEPLKKAKDALEEFLDDCGDKPVLARKVDFLSEQIQLLGLEKFGRRYSPHLLALAETIRACSTQAYRALRDLEIVTLPATETLDRLIRSLTVETGPSDLDYLRTRVTQLTSEEKFCTIVIDEIHCASKVRTYILIESTIGNFLEAWENSGKTGANGGLTGDTFRAVRHTCKTMIELARYCLSHLGWDFVMLGRRSSDKLEGHFSAYRQTHGGSYLVSVKQILESEKKLRAIALLRYSGCSLNDVKDLKDIDTIRNTAALAIAKDLSPRIDSILSTSPCEPDDTDTHSPLQTSPCEPNNTDMNIVCYVCGAMVRSHMNSTKGCGPCQRLLLNNGTKEQMPTLTAEENIPSNVVAFIEQVNRGGLFVPSNLVFGLGVKAWKVFDCIKNDKQLTADFLKATNHRAIFVEIVLKLLEEESEIEDALITDLTCANGHKFGRILINKFFNCMCKNWIREMSTAVPPGSERKVAKLTSKTAK